MERVRELASAWSKRPTKEIASRLARYESAMRIAEYASPNYFHFLVDEISQRVSAPLEWASELSHAGCWAEHTLLFLLRAAATNGGGWETMARAFLEDESYQIGAALVVLRTAHSSPELVDEAVSRLGGAAYDLTTDCLLGNIPECNVARLLKHDDPKIAGAAAMGEWLSNPSKTVRSGLRVHWEVAIVRHNGNKYQLGEILAGDAELAERWLIARIKDKSISLYRKDKAVQGAVRGLDLGAKRRLIRTLPAKYTITGLLGVLVADDCELYKELLDLPHLRAYHLIPLEGMRGPTWEGKALLAVDHGHSAHKIAEAAHTSFEFIVGKASKEWESWTSRFKALCSHKDDRMRHIGEAGCRLVQPKYDSSLKEEEREEVFGYLS